MLEEIRKKCVQLRDLKQAKAKLSAAEKQINERIEALTEDIDELFTKANLKKQHFPGIGSFTSSPKPYPQVLDQAKLHKYLRDAGDGGIIKETVAFQTLQSYVKEMIAKDNIAILEGAKDAPFDFGTIGVRIFKKPSITVRQD